MPRRFGELTNKNPVAQAAAAHYPAAFVRGVADSALDWAEHCYERLLCSSPHLSRRVIRFALFALVVHVVDGSTVEEGVF